MYDIVCGVGGEKFFTLLYVWFIVVLVVLVKRNRNFLKKSLAVSELFVFLQCGLGKNECNDLQIIN